ncbi:MAG: PRC-barrel domain-containing protein [Acidimicrobiia bacterium]|nr:PRC-barrel domain-containing protein [Acidimicrobiia bacterium]
MGSVKGGAVINSSDSGLVGRIVVDLRHEPIGKVVDVIFEDSGSAPKVGVVDPGLFRSSRYVPLARFGRTGDGRIVLPFEAEVVRSAPKAPKEHIVTPELEDLLADHYPADG